MSRHGSIRRVEPRPAPSHRASGDDRARAPARFLPRGRRRRPTPSASRRPSREPSIRDLRDLRGARSTTTTRATSISSPVAAPMRGRRRSRCSSRSPTSTRWCKRARRSTATRAANTTSVYTAAEIFPMLPEKLSTDLTSLGRGQARLAIVVEMTVARATGRSPPPTSTARSCWNRAKLAYNGVAAWLDGTAPAPPRARRGARAGRAAPHPGPGRAGA